MPPRSDLEGGDGVHSDKELDNFTTSTTDQAAIHKGDAAGGCLTGTFPDPILAHTGVQQGKYRRATIGIGADGRILSVKSNNDPVGSYNWPCKLIETDYTVSKDDSIILINADKKDVIIVLPDANDVFCNNKTRCFLFRKVDRSTHQIIIRSVGQPINRRVSSIKLTLGHSLAGFIAHDSEWFLTSFDPIVHAAQDIEDNYGAVRRVLSYEQSSIDVGKVVCAFDFDVANDCMRVVESLTKGVTHPAIGVISNKVSKNSCGTLVVFGIISGLDTSKWTPGEPLYVSTITPGELTNQRPSGNSEFKVQQIARVVSTDVHDGSIEVLGIHPFVELPLLPHQHVWVGNNSATPIAVPTSSLPRARHAETHSAGGWDEINGNSLSINYAPTCYAPEVSGEVEHETQLLAHIKGIDKALELLFNKVRNLENINGG